MLTDFFFGIGSGFGIRVLVCSISLDSFPILKYIFYIYFRCSVFLTDFYRMTFINVISCYDFGFASVFSTFFADVVLNSVRNLQL